jgi:plasmid stabilization system protein ParE
MSFQVIFSPEAEDDLQRLFDHVLERELHSATGDLEIAARAIDAIRHACRVLELTPFSCRKVGDSAFVRELIIPFGATGYVAMFEIRDAQVVLIGAVRHQRESDYH